MRIISNALRSITVSVYSPNVDINGLISFVNILVISKVTYDGKLMQECKLLKRRDFVSVVHC